MEEKEEFWLEENFITNVDEILELADIEKNNFSNRAEQSEHAFKSKRYGPSKLYTLFSDDMSEKLKQTIIKTIDPKNIEIFPDHIVINRYDPGGFLVRHKDTAGRYWKFQLIFLRTDKPHLKIYNKKYPEGKLIEEKPGALFHMPLSLEHEVTLIEENEKPKFSLVMAWSL